LVADICAPVVPAAAALWGDAPQPKTSVVVTAPSVANMPRWFMEQSAALLVPVAAYEKMHRALTEPPPRVAAELLGLILRCDSRSCNIRVGVHFVPMRRCEPHAAPPAKTQRLQRAHALLGLSS
jgi:hypothetical protein